MSYALWWGAKLWWSEHQIATDLRPPLTHAEPHAASLHLTVAPPQHHWQATYFKQLTNQISRIMDVEESPWADTSQASKPDAQTEATASQSTDAATTSSSQPAASSRPSRGPRRLVAQPTRLEAVDDPLGPLGAAAPVAVDGPALEENRPAPPQKEQLVMRTTMPPSQQPHPAQQARRTADPHRLFEDDDDDQDGQRGPRAPPPVDPAKPSSVQSSTQPSVSVEQAAKPTFQIYVGDPVKIGDLTSSHIVYSVRTKVCMRRPTAQLTSRARI